MTTPGSLDDLTDETLQTAFKAVAARLADYSALAGSDDIDEEESEQFAVYYDELNIAFGELTRLYDLRRKSDPNLPSTADLLVKPFPIRIA